MMKVLLNITLLFCCFLGTGQTLQPEFVLRTAGEIISNPNSEDLRTLTIEFQQAHDSLNSNFDSPPGRCFKRCRIILVDEKELLVDYKPVTLDSIASAVKSFLINPDNKYLQYTPWEYSFSSGESVPISRSEIHFYVQYDMNEMEVSVLREIAKGIQAYRNIIAEAAFKNTVNNLTSGQITEVNEIITKHLVVETLIPPPPPPTAPPPPTNILDDH